jgi:serine/threonine-protein kinase
VSPDGSRIALLRGTSGAGDVWTYELAGGTLSRLTFTGNCAAPIWSADGRYVYYTMFATSGAASSIARKPADGSREAETLGGVPGRSYLSLVDEVHGIAVLDSIVAASDRGDLLRVRLAPAGAAAEPLVASAFNEYGASVSPDGRWLAYQSDDTGRPEIYVKDLAPGGVRRQLTSTRGEEPHWSRDGRELYFRATNRLFAVPIGEAPAFHAGKPQPLFDGIYNSGIESGRSYDVDPKTGRFLLVVPTREPRTTDVIRVVLNWDAALGGS